MQLALARAKEAEAETRRRIRLTKGTKQDDGVASGGEQDDEEVELEVEAEAGSKSSAGKGKRRRVTGKGARAGAVTSGLSSKIRTTRQSHGAAHSPQAHVVPQTPPSSHRGSVSQQRKFGRGSPGVAGAAGGTPSKATREQVSGVGTMVPSTSPLPADVAHAVARRGAAVQARRFR